MFFKPKKRIKPMNTTSTQKVEGLQYEVCFCGNMIYKDSFSGKKGYSCIGIPLEININYYEAENFLCSKNY